MIHKKQIIVLTSVVVLMGLLLSMDIKGLVKPKEGRNTGESVHEEEGAGTGAATLTLESISEAAKAELTQNLAVQITSLEEELKKASGVQLVALQKQLAVKWDDVNKSAPAAFYYEIVAQQENTYPNWLKTGDRFTEAYQNNPDTVAQPLLAEKAINAYQKALAIQPASLDARTGLGIAYVSATANPMQGIQLLLAVVKEDPQNVKANLNLGKFSMRSGQYDKAVNRFKTVIAVQPDAETWFYLASSYEKQAMNDEAIAAYQKSKELAADPEMSKFVDKKVAELSK